MPLPADDQVVEVSQDPVSALKAAAGGEHPGCRPVHLISITLRPPLRLAFPIPPDNGPNANPRGIAIRFNIGEREHSDVIGHSTPYFPTRTGAEFLEFLKAAGSLGPGATFPSPVEVFLGSHPAALAFVQAPKPTPSSFAREQYFRVTALKFVNAEGKATYFCYRIPPDAGVEDLDEAVIRAKSPKFFHEELGKRLENGPESFKLLAQVAEEGNVTDDATVHWPGTRKLVELGAVKIEALAQIAQGAEACHL